MSTNPDPTADDPSTDRIFGFVGDHFFLSNFFVESHNLSGEHRFQKEKTFVMAERHAILDAPTPAKAKHLGRSATLRPDWEDVKVDVMRGVVEAKFTEIRNPGFAQRLLDTGTAELIEANSSGDLFWGVDEKSGEGRNELGVILMELRVRLRAEAPVVEEDLTVEAPSEPAADAIPAEELDTLIGTADIEADSAEPTDVEPTPTLTVLELTVLDALSVKGFTRQSIELRAIAVARSIRARWDEILTENAATETTVEASIEETPAEAVEPEAETPVIVVAEEPAAEEPMTVPATQPELEPEEAPAPESAELEVTPSGTITITYDGVTVDTATGEVIEQAPITAAPITAAPITDEPPAPFVPESHRIVVATDGSAAPTNPGPAGWGWYVSETCWAAGAARHQTNNRAELAAMYNLFLATAATNPPLHILCDSKYVIGAMNGNRANVNADLIEKLRAVMVDRDFTLEWVKGHNGNPLNEGADQKCTAASAAVRAGQIIPTGPGWTVSAPEPELAPAPIETLNPLTMDLPF